MTKWFDSLSKEIKVILLIPIWGWVFSALYRIFYYVEIEKDVPTLIVGILCIIPVIGFIVSLLDLVTMLTKNSFSICFDIKIDDIVNEVKEEFKEDVKEENIVEGEVVDKKEEDNK